MEKLREHGAKIEFHDPFVPSIAFAGKRMKSTPLTPTTLKRFDCVVIATAHKGVSYSAVLRYARAIVDTRNALKGKSSNKVVRL